MRRVLVALAVVGACALPAAADDGNGVAVPDACGDAPVLQLEGTTAAAGDPAYDIAGLRVADLDVDGQPAGVEVALELCGEVPAEDTSGGWSVSWALPEGCQAQVAVFERRQISIEGVDEGWAGELRVSCPSSGDVVSVGPGDQVVSLGAPAVTVQGRTVGWRLERGTLGPLESLIAPGAVVSGAQGRARSRGAFGTVFVGAGTRVTTVGTMDSTDQAPDHVLG